MKGQISMEYMVVVGFALLMVIPTVIVYTIHSNSMQRQVAYAQANAAARDLADAANAVYYVGENAQTTVKVYLPEQVVLFNATNREIIVRLEIGESVTDVLQTTNVNVVSDLSTHSGLHRIYVRNEGGYVSLNETT